LLEACRALGGCRTGEAKITRGYALPAKYVIHAVGPVWRGGGEGERELLAETYRAAFALAAEKKLESVAFPLISSGAYGFPKEEALRIAVKCAGEFLESHELDLTLVVFDRESFDAGSERFADVRSFIGDRYAAEHMIMRNRLAEAAERADFAFSMPMAASVPSEKAPEGKKKKRLFAQTEKLSAAPGAPLSAPAEAGKAEAEIPSGLQEAVKNLDEGFSDALLRLIDEKGMTDVACYKKANVDRKLFSKIRSDRFYRPGKATALAFAVALELSLPETEDLLRKAGFALSPSSYFDVIITYFILHGNYNVFEINEALFAFDQPLLG
ncbi:MAG: macro domain-containing protein, partial [Clostridia bacterium]|nr:macro domain-containing protein [Clostridia bacterium]